MTPTGPLDSMSDFKYGEHIREARQRLGLSQEAFAQALNVSPRTVARWEADDSTPHSASHRIDLAHAFVAANMEHIARELNPALDGVLSEERLLGFLPDNAVAKLGTLMKDAGAASVGAVAAAPLALGTLGTLGTLSSKLFSGQKNARTSSEAIEAGALSSPASDTSGAANKAANFAKQAKVWEALVTSAAASGISTEVFIQSLMQLTAELVERDLSFEDLKKTLS